MDKHHPTHTRHRNLRAFAISLAALTALSGCTSIDCPLNNTIYTKYLLAGNMTTLEDTLTISTTRHNGTDSVLINRDIHIEEFSLPVSYQAVEDVLYFEITPEGQATTTDTVKVRKEDLPHFESVDCSPTMFHVIQSVETTHHRIDSIVINNKNVNYDASKAHFLIYFKAFDD